MLRLILHQPFRKRSALFFSIAVLSHMLFTNPAFCWDSPFNNAANWGGTGLMEIPTARILEDGQMRLGFAQALPYRWYAASMGIFPGLEVSGRFTEVTDLPSELGLDYNSNADKAFDVKYQILPESKMFPALAIGLNDFTGTQLFDAQYLTLSRQIYPFDFTLGIGRNRLRGPVTMPFLDELGFFGGIEWAMNDWLHLMVEYNPIEYENDTKEARGVPEGAKSPVNIGARIKILPALDVGLSFQRGDTFGFMAHLQFELGKPITPKQPDPPAWSSAKTKVPGTAGVRNILDTIQQALDEAGFDNISVYSDDIVLMTELENNKYISNQKAVGRAMRILLYNAPARTENLAVILTRRLVPFLKVSVKTAHMEKYLLGQIPDEQFFELLTVESTTGNTDLTQQDLVKTVPKKMLFDSYGIKPDVETFLNDPSGLFMARVGIKPYVSTTLWKGGSATAWYDIPFYSDISSTVALPDDPVRSDSWKYSSDDMSFDRLMFDQAFQLTEKLFGRLSLGYLERMYAGIGGEILTFIGDGDLALGIEGDYVRKRSPGTHFNLLDFDSYTLFGNAYYRLQDPNITLQVKFGRFLAGDIGVRFDLSREYENGVVIGFWYSVTDTDGLDGFNRGYKDKGVFLRLPIRMFLAYETRTRYGYSISPFSRDVGATVSHWQSLYDLAADLMPFSFKSDFGLLKE